MSEKIYIYFSIFFFEGMWWLIYVWYLTCECCDADFVISHYLSGRELHIKEQKNLASPRCVKN
jgi:hypothetical protein